MKYRYDIVESFDDSNLISKPLKIQLVNLPQEDLILNMKNKERWN